MDAKPPFVLVGCAAEQAGKHCLRRHRVAGVEQTAPVRLLHELLDGPLPLGARPERTAR